MKLSHQEFKDKVLACWLGKNIGGTIGHPFEWQRAVHNVEFYTQELNGEPFPNDDLDIQLLWLIALEECGLDLNSRTLAEYWNVGVTPHWAEYGAAKSHLRAGLQPPVTGNFNNVYKHSCGAYIRSEIWACIAPGLPDVAARYAYNDAIIDHGNGEGTYGEVFFATLESAAFVVSDLRTLVRIGLSYIPAESAVARAIQLVIGCVDGGKTWQETREEVLRQFRGAVPPWCPPAAPDDVAKGLGDGPLGFDVPGNVALTVLALLHGGTDFNKVICTAVNCGEDTDCTAATAGSIFGIIHGTKGIPEKWIQPIGRSIKTICLNTGDYNWHLPKTVDELTDRTLAMAAALLARPEHRSRMALAEATELPADFSPEKFIQKKPLDLLEKGAFGPIFKFDFFTVSLNYGEVPWVSSGQPFSLGVRVQNHARFHANLCFRLYLPDGWTGTGGLFNSWPGTWSESLDEITLEVTPGPNVQPVSRGVMEISIEGHPTVMLVPLIWVHGITTRKVS